MESGEVEIQKQVQREDRNRKIRKREEFLKNEDGPSGSSNGEPFIELFGSFNTYKVVDLMVLIFFTGPVDQGQPLME